MSNIPSKKKANKLIRILKLPRDYIAFKVHKGNGNLPGAYRNLKKLGPVSRNAPSFHSQLSLLAYRQKLWKESLKHINVAIQLTDENTAIRFKKHKADTLIKLGELEEATSCLESYLSVMPNDAGVQLELASLYTNRRQWQESADSFESYLKLQPKDPFANYKLGNCYLELNRFDRAGIYYKHAIDNINPKSTDLPIAQIYYKLGFTQLKNNEDAQATKSFTKAIKNDQDLNSQRFGIGVFHEHFKQWEYAVSAYNNEIEGNGKDAELLFKLAVLLDKLSKPEQALSYYKNALKIDRIQSKWHYRLANCFEQLADYQNAAKWYKSAIVRQQYHSPGNYRRLGFALKQLGQLEEAVESFMEAELFQRPSAINKNFHNKQIKNPEVRYAISYEHYQVNKKMIFYESLSGGRMMGNPYAIFEHVFNDSKFKEFTHVWVVRSFKVIPDELRNIDNLIFVKRESDAYFRYIASAKYLICNSTFEDYVVRKPEQLYLQTSHGIFYKTVGRDSTGNPVGVAGSTRNLLQATHIIVPNEFMAKKQPKSYSIKNINSGKIAKIGYPRIDVTLNASDNLKNQIASKLKLNQTKKSVFYAPTWRGSNKSSNRFDSTKLIEDLKMLSKLDANIIFRGHTITNSLLKEAQFPDNIILPTPDIQTNEILSITDVLISDYSSVFFDFIPTERPIVHYLYDLEEYTKERGLNLTEHELPGTIAKSSKQLLESVESSLKQNKPSSHYLEVKDRFCSYDDGKSTERTVRWFFYGNNKDIHYVEEEKISNSHLYLGGTLSNKSRLPELMTELNELKQHDYTVSIMLKKKLTQDSDKLSLLKNLNPNINLLAHAGRMPATPEENAAISYFNKNEEFANKRMNNAYLRAFKRESRRLFGDSQFDYVSNYEKNSNYWSGVADNVYLTTKSN